MWSAKSALGAGLTVFILTTVSFGGDRAFAAEILTRSAGAGLLRASVPQPAQRQLMAVRNLNSARVSAQIGAQAWRHGTRTLSVSTTSLNFGTVTLNSTSTQSITLKSTGTASVTVSAVTVAGSGFSVVAPVLPLTLWPGRTAVIQVGFDPKVVGTAGGSVSISSNSSTASTTTVSLSGSGASSTANPVLTVSTTSLNFGSVTVGTPITQSVTLTSSGTSAVTVSGIGVTGTGFTMSGATFPVTLNPGVAITLQVQFDPTVVGTATGTLSIASNSSSGNTMAVTLSGTGSAAQHQVTLTWSAPVNSPVAVNGYHVYRATSSSTTFQLLNTSTDTQTRYVDQAVQAGANYNYYVTSVDSAGAESVPSNQVSITVP